MSYLGRSEVNCFGSGSSVRPGDAFPRMRITPFPDPSCANGGHDVRLALVKKQLAALTLAAEQAAPQAPDQPSELPALLAQAPDPQQPHGSTSQEFGQPRGPVPPVYVAGSSSRPRVERATLSVPVPLVDHEAPFLTLRHWDTWHDQVTDGCCKNAQGTHAAIATLMRHDANVQAFASGPAQLRQFQRIVMNDMLLNYPPVHAKDNHLWTEL
jgi:hypothetical protein